MEEANKTRDSAAADESGKEITTGSGIRKILSILLDVVLYLFLAVCVFVLIVSVLSNKNNGAVNFFGCEMRLVVSDSMAKSEFSEDVSRYKIKDLPLRTMVFIETVPTDGDKADEWYACLQKGDVVTFTYAAAVTQEVITHRIYDILTTGNGYIITLKGDNRASATAEVSTQVIYTSAADYPDPSAAYNYVIGKVTGQSLVLGYMVYCVSRPVGLALIVILPCCIILIGQAVRVTAAIAGERKRKYAELEKRQAEKDGKNDRGT